jgi:hypothetical protein
MCGLADLPEQYRACQPPVSRACSRFSASELKVHGGKSTVPRTPEGLERSRRENWKRAQARQTGAPGGSIRVQPYPEDLRALPGPSEAALSWHSGLREGAHARAAGRDLCGQDPQGRQTRRSSGRTAHYIRANHQPQNSQALGLEVPWFLQQRADEVIE